MDTKKVIAEAAYEIRKIAFQVVGHLDCLRHNPSYTGNLEKPLTGSVEGLAGQFTTRGAYAVNDIVKNARDIMKRFIPDGHVELQINRSGYPVQEWVNAPHITELLAIQSSYAFLIGKFTTEAGWGHRHRITSGTLPPPLLELIACSTCGKTTYKRGYSEHEVVTLRCVFIFSLNEWSLCGACLSSHLDRVLLSNYGLSTQS